MKKYLAYMLRLFLGVLLLIYIIKLIDVNMAINLAKDINLHYVALAFLLILSIRILMILRWKFILNFRNTTTQSGELIKIFFKGAVLGTALPGMIGPDLMKGYLLSKRNGKIHDVTASIVIDRYIGFFSMFLVALFGSLFGRLFGIETELTALLLIINILFIASFVLSKTITNKIGELKISSQPFFSKIWNFVWAIAYQKKALYTILPKTLFLSIIVQILRCIIFFLIYLAYGQKIEFIYFIIFIPIMFVISFLPVTISGLGLREGTLSYLFGFINIESEISVGVGLVFQILIIFASLPGIYFWMQTKKLKRHKSFNG
jgi:uncharacterized protein (TIRG00374 family)